MKKFPSFAKPFQSIYSPLIQTVEGSRNQVITSEVYISQIPGVGSGALAADMIPCTAPPSARQGVPLSRPGSSSISFLVPHYPSSCGSGHEMLPMQPFPSPFPPTPWPQRYTYRRASWRYDVCFEGIELFRLYGGGRKCGAEPSCLLQRLDTDTSGRFDRSNERWRACHTKIEL